MSLCLAPRLNITEWSCGLGWDGIEIVKDRTRLTLEAVIINWIRAGLVIYCDCRASYNHISTIAHKNFTHGTVKHSNKKFSFKDPITWVHSNWIEGYTKDLLRRCAEFQENFYNPTLMNSSSKKNSTWSSRQ